MTINEGSPDRSKEIHDLVEAGWSEDEARYFVAIKNEDISPDEFAAAWYRDISRFYETATRQERLDHSDDWANNALQEAGWNYPELAWKLILQLIERAPNEDMLGAVGAGPLEEMVHDHGEAFIDRIEEEMRRSSKFRTAANSIWFSRGKEHLEQRIRKFFQEP